MLGVSTSGGFILNRKPLKFTDAKADLVVGIGASAGGFNSLKKFLSEIGTPKRIAFVLVQHLDDSGRNLAHEVLTNHTSMPVREITNGDLLEGGVFYHAPPHATISLEENVFHVEHTTHRSEQISVIDSMFRSIAKDQGQRAVGIIFSGEGSDGALGLKAISDEGGMTLVQLPESAESSSMPMNAIATGAVDHVLMPDKMPAELVSYAVYLTKLLEKDGASVVHHEILAALSEICEILLRITKHEFKHYKTSTLVRRIQRRMQVLQFAKIAEYVDKLRSDPKEVDSLFKELLINVTWFFREPDAFETLKNDILAKALKVRKPDQKYRIWVAGCSTGEEVYSLAILVREILETLPSPPEVQIIATDIDEAALNQARKGSYPITISEHVSEERLKQFFIRKAGRYHVSKELREIVLFSSHNLINDPPFSQLDLISCRNVLIYLGSHLQKKLIPVFHYALRSNGCLFLGTSESLTAHKELFRTISVKHRIAQRKATSIRPPGFSTVVSQTYTSHSIEPNRNHEADLHMVGQRIILDEFAPKYAIVNDDCMIVSVSSGLAQYLEPPEGSFQNNLMKIVKPSLRVGLRASFSEAKKHKRKITHEDSTLKVENELTWVGITVQPMPQLGDESSLYMVIFQYLGVLQSSEAKKKIREKETIDTAVVEQLERELTTLREDLDRSIQDIEASNEELKSSNEELLSMNEELQSANEELETSKEDVQGANDALQRSNNDLENLLASTEIATMFLDKSLNIQSVTPQLETIYNITRHDVGRPISHFTHLAKEMPSYPDPQKVAASTDVIESDVEMADGRWMLRRISPYRTTEGNFSGIVVTFIDVTHVREAENQYRELADSMPQIVWTADPKGDVNYYNRRWYDFTAFNRDMDGDERRVAILHPDDLERTNKTWKRCVDTGTPLEIEYRFKDRINGGYRWFLGRAVPAYNSLGKIIKWYGSCIDIHDRKLIEEQQAESEALLNTMFNTSTSFMSMLKGPNFVFEKANQSYMELIGKRDIIGKPVLDALPEIATQQFISLLKGVYETGVPFIGKELPAMLQRVKGGPLEKRYIDLVYQLDETEEGDGKRIFVHGHDVTEKVISRAGVENERENFRNLFRQTPEMVCILLGPEHLFEFSNDAHQKALGFNPTGMKVRDAQPESVEVHGILDNVYQTGKTAELNEIPITLGDRLRYFNLTYSPRRDLEGNINGVMILGQEISEQVANREEIKKTKNMAEAANESKTRFLANMSHEIRTPLAAILGFSDLLQGRTKEGDADAAFQLDRIARNANQLGRLIDELLDLSKIEAGRFEVEKENFELMVALDDAMASVALQAREKGLSFHHQSKGKVPRFINTDPTRFRQVLTNVIGNAVKFTEKGQVDVEFECKSNGPRNYLHIHVKDSGIGLSPEQQKKIFEPFVQADASVTRRYGGTGLGLILSKRLTNLMGGELVLEKSNLGEGSTFLITIDIGGVGDVPAETLPTREKTLPSMDVLSLNGKRILVVDDAPDNQTIIKVFLGKVGARIELANNGQEAVEKMTSGTYDVVLMDIQMPVLDGYEALKVARQKGYKGAIVALTAHAMKEEKERCLAAGFTDYLSKPIDRAQLIQRVIELSK